MTQTTIAEKPVRRHWLKPAVSLTIIAGLSAGVVWAGNAKGWPAATMAALLFGFLAILAGGAVGVHVLPCLAAFTVFALMWEGMVWGGSRYGWIGSVLMGGIGFVLGHLVWLPLLMLHHMVLLLVGIDPLAGCEQGHREQNG